MAFSVISNGEKIIDMKTRPGTLPILDGMRFISTTWVVLGHTLQMMFYGIDNSVFGRRTLLNDASSMVILNAFFSVDSFFFLSGLLVAYLGMKHIVKQNGYLNIFLMYLQRYLRLTPLYAFLILFHMSIYKYFGTGPFWQELSETNYETCKDTWWTNLLYINNLYPVSNNIFMGLGLSLLHFKNEYVAWYLANDMQFFLLAPLFIYLLYRSRIVGILSIVSVIIGSTVVNGVLTSVYELQPTVIQLVSSLSFFYRWYIWIIVLFYSDQYSYEDKFSSDTYMTPWSRIHVYMIGMLTGYILYVCKGKVKMNKIIALIGWIVAAAVALALIYAPWPYVKDMENMEIELSAAYSALGRPLWGFCLAWVVIACSSGYGGPVTKFLNWKVFTPLSRLTYSTYLIHIYVLYGYAGNQDQPLHFLIVNYMYIYLASLFLSFGCGFILSVTIEWPFIGLCKLLFNPCPPKVQQQRVMEDTSPEDTVSESSSSDNEKWRSEVRMHDFKHPEANNEKGAYENSAFQEKCKADEISTNL